jgi:hypothetical protein
VLITICCFLLIAGQHAPKLGPTDPKTVDAAVHELYSVISGPAGQKRDWERFKSLFAPEGRLIATMRRSDGTVARRTMTPDEYIAGNAKFMEERGFFEKEIARREEIFAGIAHVWSTYEARQNADDPAPLMRGINSIQLQFDGQRWWILSVYWQAEDKDNPLPARYLPDR